MTHRIDPRLLRREVDILLVGCGGTGCAIAAGLPYLHQAMVAAGHPGGLRVTIMDGDTISPTNCVRQPFGMAEIGLYKAVVMANRLNLFWGLNWSASPGNFTKASNLQRYDIVICCVDTRSARATIAEVLSKKIGSGSGIAYWLDLGNNADSGQFVLGQPLNGRNKRSAERLRTVAELFPEILRAELDANDGPSCSAEEALDRQEPFVNQVLANHALALLARLFRHGEISYHGGFASLASGRCSQLPVDPAAWQRMKKAS